MIINKLSENTYEIDGIRITLSDLGLTPLQRTLLTKQQIKAFESFVRLSKLFKIKSSYY